MCVGLVSHTQNFGRSSDQAMADSERGAQQEREERGEQQEREERREIDSPDLGEMQSRCRQSPRGSRNLSGTRQVWVSCCFHVLIIRTNFLTKETEALVGQSWHPRSLVMGAAQHDRPGSFKRHMLPFQKWHTCDLFVSRPRAVYEATRISLISDFHFSPILEMPVATNVAVPPLAFLQVAILKVPSCGASVLPVTSRAEFDSGPV